MNILKATIGDVAKKAGVSITTVSRVINNNYPVSSATRRKVEDAVSRLNFTPNTLARGLIQKKTFTIGVVVPSITNLFFPEVVNGIETVMQPEGYTFFLTETLERDEKEKKHVNRLLERQIDGIIVIGPSNHIMEEGFYERITGEIPTVIVNGFNKGIKCNFVLTDEKSGIREVLEYLYGLKHRNMAFMRGRKSYSYDLKEKVYKDFFIEKSIPLNEDNIIEIESGNNIASVKMAENAISRRLAKPEPPTAVVCCNDWMAVGAVRAADALGLAVPEDISVTGFDNILVSQLNKPEITTVDQGMNDIGKSAARLLLELINGGNRQAPLKKIILETKLVKRKSVKQPEGMV